ncbi:unnamed protein product [Larinioides sclopetarius]|uniref:H/ACA ribonucleoprotein complex non-core subunit NAF1 n=1 Tax=Larinioides sclopetarius TaxID=280406 RepID=A0AAV1YQH3_9ARAC
MKLEMESKEIKDTEMGVNNKTDSQHKGDSVVNSSASTSLATTDGMQSNKVLAEEISISKEILIVKQEDSKVFTINELGLQNTDSESDDCVVTSTSESNSSKSQKLEVLSETRLYDAFSLATTKESQCTINIKDSKSHRQNIHYSSESSDYETDESSDSSDCEDFFDNLRKSVGPIKLPVLKTKGELTTGDLPPVEDLHITVNSTELLKIGHILHWVVAEERNEFLVIVESDGNSNPLDDDSVLFLSSDKPLGKIHDVFGNVNKPNYVVRFNKAEDIFDKGVTAGQIVYYSPANGELTRYVLVDVLKKQKGSDASWRDNNEPPEDEIDYSDDEQEKLAKQKRRAKTRGKERNWNDREGEDTGPNKMERRDADHSQKRVFKRPSRNMFQSPTPVPPRSSPRPYSPQSFGSPPSENFGSSGQRRNAVSPQPFGYSIVPSQPLGPFPQNSVSSYQPFTVPPTSYALASSNLALSQATGAPQINPSSFMTAPQNNVPFRQSYDNFGSSGLPRNAVSPQPFVPTSSNSNPYRPFLQGNGPTSQPFGQFPQSNAPSPQPFEPLHRNVPSPQPFEPLHHNVPSPQSFGPLHCNVPSPQSFGPLHRNVPSPQSFGPLHRDAPSPQPFEPLHRNVSSPQPFGPLHRNVPSPQSFGPLNRNVPSPQSFGPLHRNVPSPQSFGPLNRNVPSPQLFGSFLHSNTPSQQRFGQLPYSTVPSQPLRPFPQNSVSSYQPFTVPPTSYALASSNLALSYATGASQLNPSSLMSAPQNNIPLQQQLLLQSHQPFPTFLSHPPPN